MGGDCCPVALPLFVERLLATSSAGAGWNIWRGAQAVGAPRKTVPVDGNRLA